MNGATMEPEEFPVDHIATRPDWQVRTKLDPGTISRYKTAYREGAELPPILLARIEGALFVVDGCHRLEAAKQAGLYWISAKVVTSDATEALWEAAKANLTHGLPLKPREQRGVLKAFIKARKNYVKKRMMSYREIAKALGGVVGHTTIRGWIMKDFPKLAESMRDDMRGGFSEAGPSWKLPTTGPADTARQHLDSFVAILKGLPTGEQEALKRLAEEALNPLEDHGEF